MLTSVLYRSLTAKRGEAETIEKTSAENSDVFPFVSVAVALMAVPARRTMPGNFAVMMALPKASVVTVVVPRSVWPWPWPEGSAFGLEKNWTV